MILRTVLQLIALILSGGLALANPPGTFNPLLLAGNRACAATSYANTGGTGNRTASISATDSGIVWAAGTTPNLINGSFAQNSSNSVDETTVSITGQWIQFDFGVNTFRLIDEMKFYAASNNTNYNVTFQGSDSTSGFTDFTTANMNQTTTGGTNSTGVTASTGGYRYYRIFGNSGVGANTWFEEIEFKISACS